MHILHTEASLGWGGQEMRILEEAKGMRNRGHTIVFAIQNGGKLASQARQHGFDTYEIPLEKKYGPYAIAKLISIINRHKIDIVNTHSSTDAWIGGIAGRLLKRKIIRTRHLSAHIRPGLNSYLLYNTLADAVVTTCEEVARIIQRQAKLPPTLCMSIPTGIEVSALQISAGKREAFREKWGIKSDECLVGTVCILRSWKGVLDFLHAARILQHNNNLKWMIVGSGPIAEQCKQKCDELKLNDRVIFTGMLEDPFPAIEALDIFALLSTANEGVSQASLQAAFFKKPLITTTVGGLSEVCLDGITGYNVPIKDPEEVAKKVSILYSSPKQREHFGQAANKLVVDSFTMEAMLDKMEILYRRIDR